MAFCYLFRSLNGTNPPIIEQIDFTEAVSSLLTLRFHFSSLLILSYFYYVQDIQKNTKRLSEGISSPEEIKQRIERREKDEAVPEKGMNKNQITS